MHAIEIEPYLKAPSAMKTLGHALASIISQWSKLPRKQKRRDEQRIYDLRTAAYAITQILGRECSLIPLEQMLDLDGELIRLAEAEGTHRNYPRHYAAGCHRILKHAASRGWSCREMELREAWIPARAALGKKTGGCLQMVDYFTSQKLTPGTTTEANLNAWGQQAHTDGLSLSSVEQYTDRFRCKLRAAGLEAMFPNLDLESKSRSHYADKLSDMSPKVQKELRRIEEFRTATWMPDRGAKIAVRTDTVRRMYKSVRQIHGFRTRIQKRRRPSSLRELIKPAIILPFIDWLVDNRKLLRDGVKRILGPILVVLRNYPAFEKDNYEWIAKRIQEVPKERHYKRTERKEAKAVPYELLVQIPTKLRARTETPGLSAVEIAWLWHDAAIISILLYLAYRQRNIRECGVAEPAGVNLVSQTLSLKMLHDLNPPDWVRDAYAEDPRRKFWLFTFLEGETKADRAVTDIVPLEIIPLLEAYVTVHRCELIDPENDHGMLFFNRRRTALSENNLRDLVCRLTKTYVGKRVTPHLWRDIFSANFRVLSAAGIGRGDEELQDRLWHIDEQTTDGYSQLDYAEPGIVALNQEFAVAA